jgi:hypothetical protein
MRRVIGMLVIFIAASGCGSATHLPTLGGDVRPAWWANGDASWIVGGLDGTGQRDKRGYPNVGHIHGQSGRRQKRSDGVSAGSGAPTTEAARSHTP